MANKKTRKRKIVKTSYFRKFFSVFFVSINVLIIALVVLIRHCSIDYYSVKDLLNHLFPSIIIIGVISWLAGLILDNPKKSLLIDYKDLVYEELLKTNHKISPEELEQKLKTKSNEEEQDEENFAFEDADFNLGESEIEL